MRSPEKSYRSLDRSDRVIGTKRWDRDRSRDRVVRSSGWKGSKSGYGSAQVTDQNSLIDGVKSVTVRSLKLDTLTDRQHNPTSH